MLYQLSYGHHLVRIGFTAFGDPVNTTAETTLFRAFPPGGAVQRLCLRPRHINATSGPTTTNPTGSGTPVTW